MVRTRELTPDQKKAIALTLKQINEGTMDNTNLDSREMYELRSSLFDSAYHK
jgi:hypothetical protein